MDKNELDQVKGHVDGAFDKLKASHKLGLVIAVIVIGIFIAISVLFPGTPAG